MNRIFIITQNDLIYYPPLQTLIMVMLNSGLKVVFIGKFSDKDAKIEYEKKGVLFEDLVLDESGNFIQKFVRQNKFAKRVDAYLNKSGFSNTDLIWYIYSGATVCVLSKFFYKYNYIVHFYEFFNSLHSWKYRYVYPSYSLSLFLQQAKGVVHCEYNRAQICRGLYGLDKLPYIIPNKPYVDEEKLKVLPKDISDLLSEIRFKLKDKRAIIYQGFFDAKERRLEEFCQAMSFLPDNYLLVIMGKGSKYFDDLRRQYESGKILFIPFVRPPYHLLITKEAKIGILTYHPQQRTYAGVINPLYCAPNKIYEYGMFGVPMIGNDIPGLKYVFSEYHCGRVLSYPITPGTIAKTIQEIDQKYNLYSDGSRKLYDSVNIEKTITDILNSI